MAGCGLEETVPAWQNKYLVRPSPGGTYEVTFYNFGKKSSGFLGATVTTPKHVNVRRRSEPFHPEQGQVFAMRHGHRLRLTWKSERHLLIEYPDSAGVEKKVPRMGGIIVQFRSVPQSRLPEPHKALPPE